MTLAGRLWAFQLLIGLIVLVAVAAVSLNQSAETFRREETRRALAIAETVADTPVVRDGVDDWPPRASLTAAAERARALSGATFVIVADTDPTVLTSPDPRQIGERLPLGDSEALNGRAWTGTMTLDGRRYAAAQVPIYAENQDVAGLVAVGRAYPDLWQRLGDATPSLATYLGVAAGVGVLGSWLIARRVKRDTFGMEPDEIASLVEHREAMVHGIKEGVISLDLENRITLVNDSGRQLLELPEDCVGRRLDEIGVDRRLFDVLTNASTDLDRLAVTGSRVLVLNRMPMLLRGRVIGSVTTLRDRTELVSLERELGITRSTTEALRAQTHEFDNRLHTISGLLHLGEYDELAQFVDRISRTRATLDRDVTSRVEDPTLAALLIAKSSLAAERGIEFRLTETSRLARVEEGLAVDLTTVAGNLIDNALESVGDTAGDGGSGWIEVDVHAENGHVAVSVRDSGAGVDPVVAEEVFRQGYTTKDDGSGEPRGFGLAITRLVCERRHGGLSVHSDGGAVFVARLSTAATPPS